MYISVCVCVSRIMFNYNCFNMLISKLNWLRFFYVFELQLIYVSIHALAMRNVNV